MNDARALLEVSDLVKHYPVRGGVLRRQIGIVHAVDGVSFTLGVGETLGLVGESGCGKSTVARSILRLVEPTSGGIRLNQRDITHLSKAELRPVRRAMQIIFQDPFASLNPRMRAGDIVGEPLSVHGIAAGREKRERVAELFEQVGLRPDQMHNYPHQFSGGQRQRICIARALSLEPSLIVCDEPVSALDVSIQAQVINLLIDLQRRHGFSYLFIAHDLAVVAHISHRVAVMYLGRIVELAEKTELFANPRHPYTQALLASVPVADPRIKRLKPEIDGDVPSPINPPSGCAFHTRCRHAMERCKVEVRCWPKPARSTRWRAGSMTGPGGGCEADTPCMRHHPSSFRDARSWRRPGIHTDARIGRSMDSGLALRAPRNDGGYGGFMSASISTTIFPVVTCSPSATSIAEIVPEIGAVWTCSIFMASRVMTGWPASTRSPGLTSTATTRPFMAARTLPSPAVAAAFAGAARVRSRTATGIPRYRK